ncbi:MAG: hypothetical protein Q4A31_01615 [Corynebacterium sp.]|nr:hypothetical protein [Corynebacterium sp.]
MCGQKENTPRNLRPDALGFVLIQSGLFSGLLRGVCAAEVLGSAFALVPVSLVEEVAVTIVNVVNVVAVLDSLVAATLTMDMVVILMNIAVHFQ